MSAKFRLHIFTLLKLILIDNVQAIDQTNPERLQETFMNQESLGNTQDLNRTQDRRTGRPVVKNQQSAPQEEECSTGTCELHWKPAKNKRS